MEVECPVGNVVGSVEQVGGICLLVSQWYVYISSIYFFFLVDFFTEYESVHPNLHRPRWSWQWEVCSGGKKLMTQQAHVSRCPCWFMFCVLIVDTHLLTCICLLTSIAFVDKHFDCWHAFVCWHQFVDKQFWLLTCRDPRQSLASSRAAIAARHAMSSSGAQICSELLKAAPEINQVLKFAPESDQLLKFDQSTPEWNLQQNHWCLTKIDFHRISNSETGREVNNNLEIKMTVRGTMVRSEVCNSWCFCLES